MHVGLSAILQHQQDVHSSPEKNLVPSASFPLDAQLHRSFNSTALLCMYICCTMHVLQLSVMRVVTHYVPGLLMLDSTRARHTLHCTVTNTTMDGELVVRISLSRAGRCWSLGGEHVALTASSPLTPPLSRDPISMPLEADEACWLDPCWEVV